MNETNAKPARIAGKRGRIMEPHPARALLFIHHCADLPAAKYPVDVTGGITDWKMLGNGPDQTCDVAPDGVGDCTFAGRQHYRMAKAARGQENEAWETSDQLVEEYLAYNHGEDQGANIPTLLSYWFHSGKILAFAPVDHRDPAKVDAAMQAFSGVYCGVSLTDDANQLFANGQPWTVSDGQQPDPNDGHCIVKVKADGKQLDGYITWGAEQPADTGWTAACLEEAWVIITEEDVADKKIELDELIEAIHALGGTAKAPEKDAA